MNNLTSPKQNIPLLIKKWQSHLKKNDESFTQETIAHFLYPDYAHPKDTYNKRFIHRVESTNYKNEEIVQIITFFKEAKTILPLDALLLIIWSQVDRDVIEQVRALFHNSPEFNIALEICEQYSLNVWNESRYSELSEEIKVRMQDSPTNYFDIPFENNPITIFNSKINSILPPDPRLFKGRQKDIDVIALLLESQRYIVIRGWPGIGKTSLAAKIAHHPAIQSQFPDGILWTSLDQKPNLIERILPWGHAVGIKDTNKFKSPQDVQQAIIPLLKEKKCLAIIDDVWDPKDAEIFHVVGKYGAILVTTRLPEVANALVITPNAIYPLDGISETASVELMNTLAPDIVSKHLAEIQSLASKVEYLPLALQVAARLLQIEAGYGWEISNLLHQLEQENILLNAHINGIAQDTSPTIASLLEKSIVNLDSLTHRCFAYLAAMDKEPATFDMIAIQAAWKQLDIAKPKPIITRLINRGLLNPVNNRYQMHALLFMLAKSLWSS